MVQGFCRSFFYLTNVYLQRVLTLWRAEPGVSGSVLIPAESSEACVLYPLPNRQGFSLLRAAFPSCSALSPQQCHCSDSAAWASQRGRVTNTLRCDECVKGTRAAPEQRMPSHEPLNKLLSLPAAPSPGHFSAHYSRLAPSGVPAQSSPLLPSDPCTENANSAPFEHHSSSFLREWLSLYLRKQNSFPKLSLSSPRAVQAVTPG